VPLISVKHHTYSILVMCFKAAPGTTYRKCDHTVEGVEKIYDCKDKPNDPNCANPPYNHSITAKMVNEFCPDCKDSGRS
jgi:Zn finger protein HypA/HybF involved in hydrogenase expression